ncbi:MAG: hypothetical protein L3K14_07115 [Thermoplasmata archaeon]|nr:hypothetical protein [Thermoplasmata archaeon]
MSLLYAPVFVPAFLIVLLEMTEVVALVFALGGGARGLRTAVWGAISGTALVAAIALVAGAAVERLPSTYVLGPSAVVLAAFGVFLFQSTVRSYRRAQAASGSAGPAPEPHPVVQFGSGFSVGAVEATEAVIVLLALAAPGYGFTALVAALAAGALLVGLAVMLHGQIRRIKIPALKTAATALLFTFAVFWAGETLGFHWPGSDLVLLPLFIAAALLVRGAVRVTIGPSIRVETKS